MSERQMIPQANGVTNYSNANNNYSRGSNSGGRGNSRANNNVQGQYNRLAAKGDEEEIVMDDEYHQYHQDDLTQVYTPNHARPLNGNSPPTERW